MALNSIASTERVVEDFLRYQLTTYPLANTGRVLNRSGDADVYDQRARTPHPVAGAKGERLLEWQLAQIPEESWAECERHSRAIVGRVPWPTPPPPAPTAAPPARDLGPLFCPR